jgi:hypothetical protein
MLPDGSYRSVLIDQKITGRKREALIEAARRGEDVDEASARHVRVVEYDVPDREGNGKDELIVLVTTITDYRQATAETLARAYHERWVRHEALVRREALRVEGGGRPSRWAVAAAWWKLSAA